ncbi:hypothetical protein [Paraburkholderia youngii]|uniref:hypothetical protein n=1 Tax=Paraburkholderia youngii TaxID=2782701 RepID=UPI003D1F782D
MDCASPSQSVSAEHERLAEHLTRAIRELRKYGFYIGQDPLAASQREAAQMARAVEAACPLLNVASSDDTRQAPVVQALARELIESATVAAARVSAMAVRANG